MGKTGMTVVFTNGCFDILHRGHVEYLKQSRALGDKLVVGINSDESVRQLKPGRPINKQEDRKAVLEALRCVDEVIIFNELRPLELIKKVKPDIITKGGDYTVDQVSGDGIAKVVIIPFLNGYSSTGIINEINRVC
jgi:D-beta-D-heptose 7-phosphate kinase/D-beta-D-heptose 1-phosphate adenosyltransferase